MTPQRRVTITVWKRCILLFRVFVIHEKKTWLEKNNRFAEPNEQLVERQRSQRKRKFERETSIFHRVSMGSSHMCVSHVLTKQYPTKFKHLRDFFYEYTKCLKNKICSLRPPFLKIYQIFLNSANFRRDREEGNN